MIKFPYPTSLLISLLSFHLLCNFFSFVLQSQFFFSASKKSGQHTADLKTNQSQNSNSETEKPLAVSAVSVVSCGAILCSVRCVHFSGVVRCAIRGELSAEQSCADIVIKSTTARVSSPHSPLICQPCSDGRLRKYMQNRWIRPLHTLPPNFRLFHTLQAPRTPSPPLPPTLATPNMHTNIFTHTQTASQLRFPSSHSRDDLKPITLIEAQSHLN